VSIRDIENSIIDKLKENFSNLLVDGFPEKPQEFTLIHPVGAILVHYRGGNYSNTDALGFISQDKKMDFAITVVTRNLRSNNGAYEVLEKIKQVLCGFKILGCSKLTPVKEGFLSEISGIWQYEITFTLATPSIEDLEEGGINAG
jgi:hypothetical protein